MLNGRIVYSGRLSDPQPQDALWRLLQQNGANVVLGKSLVEQALPKYNAKPSDLQGL